MMVTRTLGEICDEVGGTIRTGPFGSQLHKHDYIEEGVPVVMPKDIIEGKVSLNSIAQISSKNVERLSQHKLQTGDIVYGRRGDIGRHALIGTAESGYLCGTGCLRISLGTSVVDPLFLHYFLEQPHLIAWVTNQATGATMPNLNTGILRSIAVVYPPLPTQRKIAAVLSPYDDLIENNVRRIAILEEMAAALYREWFIELRFPGHASVPIAESEQGRVPQGWAEKVASDVIEFDPTTKVPKAGEKPFVPMGSLSNNSLIISDFEQRAGNSGAKFKNGDTLFARITPCLENGKTGYVQFLPSDDAVAFGSTEFIVMRAKTISPEMAYLMARSDEFREHAIQSMSGATGRQRVHRACFDQFRFVQPDATTIAAFSEQVTPMFDSINLLAQRNANLRATRDLLLPKLVAGEVDVSQLVIAGADLTGDADETASDAEDAEL